MTDATSPFRVYQKSCDLDDMGDFWTEGDCGQDVAMFVYVYEDGLAQKEKKNRVLLLLLRLILLMQSVLMRMMMMMMIMEN